MSSDVMGFWESVGIIVIQWIMHSLQLSMVELNYEEHTVTMTSRFLEEQQLATARRLTIDG